MSSSSEAKKQLVTIEGSQNYLQWHTRMKAFLQMTGSWTYAANDIAQPALAADVITWQATRDKCPGTIVIYCSGLVQQAITTLDNPHTIWETLQTTYGTLGAAGIYVEFRKAVHMQIKENEDPNPCIQEMQLVFSYLMANGLTLPDSARAIILLSALPSKWEGFASTILATLPVAALAAGRPALTFAVVLPKIQEEWSCQSNSSIMPREAKKERQQNVQAGPSKKPLCQKCKKTGHTTSEHQDNYHPTYNIHSPLPAQNPLPKKKSQRKKKDYKGKGKQHNDTVQVASIVQLDSDDESDTGYASQTAEAGWSMLTSTPNILTSESSSVHERWKKKELDDDYACRQAPCAPMYSAYNNDDNYGHKHYTYYTGVTHKCQCPSVSKANPKCSCITPLWLMDSGATDHSTPFLNDFMTFKWLPKPVKVRTTGTKHIYFTGIGTIIISTEIDGKRKEICLQQVYYSPSGDKRICSLQWLTNKLHMQIESNAKTTRIFNSRNQPFLVRQPLLPRNNLHWFIGKPHTRTAALGFSVNLNIKSLDTVQLATVRDEVSDYGLWHQHLGHPGPQTMWHASRTTDGLDNLSVPMTTPVCPDCQIGKMPTRSFPPSEKRETKPLSMVHCDLVEFPVESYYWHKYCLTIIDNYSGYGTICLLRLKSDTAHAFQTWITWAEKQMSHPLLRVHSDRGGEFLANTFCTFLRSKGVEHQLSVTDHLQQNGCAEQFNRTLLEKEETMRHTSCLPKNLWNFALDTAVHVYNRTPMQCLDWKTPVELVFNKKPDISYLRVFRCLAYVHIPKDQ